MSDQSTIKEFPDIGDKLKAAPKKSLFERQKAEAEAKRLREEEENAAVLDDIVRSLDDDDDTFPTSRSNAPGTGGLRGAPPGNPPRRHFAPTASKMKSGPGTLGPDPAFSRKRGPDGYLKEQDRGHGILAFENSSTGSVDVVTAFRDEDDMEERPTIARAVDKAAPKPTVHLSSLPPGTSHAVIQALIPTNLPIEGIKILPPKAPGSQERKSMSAIVTLSSDTPAMDIDAVVSQLQNRYLGRGYYLSISRHLSSATLGGSLGASSMMTSTGKLPFNAKQIQPGPYGPLNRAPPPGPNKGFAPPSSFAPSGPGQFNRAPSLQVNVPLPSNIHELKLIHKTIESLVNYGAEFEALLMKCAEVQRDEKWAWLWDSRSSGGIYYRWKLWEVLSGAETRKNQNQYIQEPPRRVFDEGPPWQAPDVNLRFEYSTYFDEFASDSDYDSSEEEESDDERIANRHRDHLSGEASTAALESEEKEYLNPFEKAKLTHLLARLPTSTARLRRGDVARVSNFAISHSAAGVHEIVDMLVSNIETPFAWTGANVHRQTASSSEDSDSDDAAAKMKEKEKEKDDPSSAKLVALYVITDLLSSCANAGVRGAWRYRNAFTPVLERRHIFEKLGRLEKELQWGRIRTDKWRRAIGAVLNAWEINSVLDARGLQRFKDIFEKPQLTIEEKEKAERKETEDQEKVKAKNMWKSVEEKTQEKEPQVESRLDAQPTDLDRSSDRILNDERMDLDEMDNRAMGEENVDGEPMDEEELAELELEEDELIELLTEEEFAELEGYQENPTADDDIEQSEEPHDEQQSSKPDHSTNVGGETAAAKAKRNRPKAIDMFASSDEE